MMGGVATKGLEASTAKLPDSEITKAAKEMFDKLKPSRAGDTLTLSIDPIKMITSLRGARMEAQVEGGGADGKAAAETKKDDGGL